MTSQTDRSSEDDDDVPVLTWRRKFCYSVGHVQNDLCASMWFSYMLLYMHKIVTLDNLNAGIMILVGQVADGLATPFVGFESDRTKHGRYGRRKKWHLLGVICVAFSFPFLFNMCVYKCSNAPPYALMIYYIPFIVIFQFGWAATQISHLSLIPELTSCEAGKVELNAMRYFFTVMSNLLVFVVCFLLFSLNDTSDDPDVHLSRLDAPKFQILGIGVVGLGLVFVLVFHLGVHEPRVDDFTSKKEFEESCEAMEHNKTVPMWFKTPLFYQVGALYMFTRLIVNITQIYISYFVLDTLKLDKSAIAIAPGVIYISGIVASIIAKKLNAKFGLKWTFFFGLCLVAASCGWFYVLESLPPSKRLEVYGACVFLGMGGSTLLINSLAMISELIGKNTGTSAFVFGAMSFLDKVSNGGGVMIIQYLHPCNSIFCTKATEEYYRYIMSFVPAGCTLLAFLVLLTLIKSKFKRSERRCERQNSEDVLTVDVDCNYTIQSADDPEPC